MMEVIEIELQEHPELLTELEEFVVSQGVAEKIAFLADITPPYLAYNRAFALLEKGELKGGMVLAQNFASTIWVLAAEQATELMTLYHAAEQIAPEGAFFLTEKEFQLMESCTSLEIDEIVLQMQRDSSVQLADQSKFVEAHPEFEAGAGWNLEQVGEEELDRLDAFYQQYYYHAWHRDSFFLGPIYWIRQDDEIIAVASCQSKYQEQIMIGNIFVRPEARGRGLGEAIVVQLIRDLEAQGVRVGLFVDEINQRAIGLYRKLGFGVFQRRIFI